MPETPEFTGAIIFCPCCCTTIDAEQWGPQDHICNSCGTKFHLDLDPQIVAEHALIG